MIFNFFFFLSSWDKSYEPKCTLKHVFFHVVIVPPVHIRQWQMTFNCAFSVSDAGEDPELSFYVKMYSAL